VPKIKKILLYEMKILVPNYSCLHNPWLRGYRPQIPVLSVLCPQLNLLNPPRKKFLGTPLTCRTPQSSYRPPCSYIILLSHSDHQWTATDGQICLPAGMISSAVV